MAESFISLAFTLTDRCANCSVRACLCALGVAVFARLIYIVLLALLAVAAGFHLASQPSYVPVMALGCAVFCVHHQLSN